MRLRFNRGSAVLGLVAALALPAAVAMAEPAAKSVLPFVEDDYAAALKQARATHKPIFVDVWAPW
jgi:hypothetical protein